MARYCQSNFRCYIFLLLALIQFWSNEFVECGSSPVKKTIVSDGDIIDCVDIYKQPAFSDPLLKNHKMQMKHIHRLHLKGLETRNSSTNLFQSWHKDGECPLGTIPIMRTPRMFGFCPVVQRNRWFNTSSASSEGSREFAIAFLPNGKYVGLRASFNVWLPKMADVPKDVEIPAELSISKMSVKSGDGDKMNAILAGWKVQAGDNNTRIFIAWTRDGFFSTGCFDLHCPGFVQSSHRIAFGGALAPISIYGGKQSEFKLAIKKDQKTGAWVLLFNDHYIGYWPKDIFTSLADAATTASFGGEVPNTESTGHFTTTQMGSGHFAEEGYGKAAYITHIGYIDNGNVFKDADILIPFVTSSSCYDLITVVNNPKLGAHIFFGGPGYSSKCQ